MGETSKPLVIASLVLISEKSFVKEVKKGGRKVYDTAKEENVKRNVGDEFETTKERYEYLKSKNAVNAFVA